MSERHDRIGHLGSDSDDQHDNEHQDSDDTQASHMPNRTIIWLAHDDCHWCERDGEGRCAYQCHEGQECRASVDSLLGAAPDWCGGMSVDDYMDQVRGR